ncbi:MAG: lysoplasmalogenase [Nocardioidaceae bacterium]
MPRLKTVLAAAAYTGLAAADSALAGRPSVNARRARYALKPALMPALATATLSRPNKATFPRYATVAAQALSWGGDVALLGSGQRAFLGGVGSFFGAHVAYLAAFAATGLSPDRHKAANAAKLWMTTAPAIAFAAGRKDPDLRIPVGAYATILAAMFGASTMLDERAIGRAATRAVQAGTTLFLLSDTLLATRKFLLGDRHPRMETAVMATYTTGQGLIAIGLTGGRRDA